MVTQANVASPRGRSGGVKIMARKEDCVRSSSNIVSELKNFSSQESISDFIGARPSKSSSSRSSARSMNRNRSYAATSIGRNMKLEVIPDLFEEDRQPEEEPSWLEPIREDSVAGGRAYESYNRYLADNASINGMEQETIPGSTFISSEQNDDRSVKSSASRLSKMMGMRRHSSGRSVQSSSSTISSRRSSARSTPSQKSNRSQRSSSSRSQRSGRKSKRGRRFLSSSRRMDTLAEIPEGHGDQPIPLIIELDKKAEVDKRVKVETKESIFSSVTSYIDRITLDPDEICSDFYDEQIEAGLIGESMSDDDSGAYT